MKKHLKRSWGWSGHPTNLQIKQIKGGEKVAGEGSRWQGQGQNITQSALKAWQMNK